MMKQYRIDKQNPDVVFHTYHSKSHSDLYNHIYEEFNNPEYSEKFENQIESFNRYFQAGNDFDEPSRNYAYPKYIKVIKRNNCLYICEEGRQNMCKLGYNLIDFPYLTKLSEQKKVLLFKKLYACHLRYNIKFTRSAIEKELNLSRNQIKDAFAKYNKGYFERNLKETRGNLLATYR